MVKRGFQFFVFSMFILAVVLSLGIVSAANATVTNVLFNSNSTALYDEGHFTINWTVDSGDAANYTIYLWMNDNIVSITEDANDSLQNYTFTNSTQANYTFTIETITAEATAGFGHNATNSTNVSMYIDTTAPEMTFTIPVSGWAKGNVLPAVNVTDSLSNLTSLLTFYYGFENSTGNFSISSDDCAWTGVTASGYNCTSTFNVSALADGNYTFWVNVSDVAGNIGYARVGALTAFGVDSAGPVVSISKTLSSPTGITFSKSCTDSGSGVATCSVSSPSGTFSGNDLTGLTCGASYDVTLTSTDGLGNSRSTTTAMATSTCPSRGSSVTASSPWTSTHTLDDNTFTQGYTGQIGANKRIQVQIGTEAHHVGVVSVSASEVTIEIASDPVTVKLSPGEDTKVDVNNDQFYDVYVLLNSIVNGKADLTIKKISEEVPTGSGNVATTGEVETGVSDESKDVLKENRDLTWLWVLMAIAIVLVVLKLGVKKKKRISRF